MTGVIVTAPDCAPLLIDTCGGLELARQLELVGFERADLRAVILTHRHLDHTGGIQDLLLARMPLDIYALLDTHEGIAAVTQGSFPEWELHPDIARHEIAPGVARDLVGFRVEFFRAEHRVPTVAVRVSAGDKTFAFSADTLPCNEVIACAKNAALFFATPFARIPWRGGGSVRCERYACHRQRGRRNGHPRRRRRSRLYTHCSLRPSRQHPCRGENAFLGSGHGRPRWRPLPHLNPAGYAGQRCCTQQLSSFLAKSLHAFGGLPSLRIWLAAPQARPLQESV